jgi:hypothetical protein
MSAGVACGAVTLRPPPQKPPTGWCFAAAVEAANRNLFGCPERTKEDLAGLGKSIRAAAPLDNEVLHEAETFAGGFGAQLLDAIGQIEKRRYA